MTAGPWITRDQGPRLPAALAMGLVGVALSQLVLPLAKAHGHGAVALAAAVTAGGLLAVALAWRQRPPLDLAAHLAALGAVVALGLMVAHLWDLVMPVDNWPETTRYAWHGNSLPLLVTVTLGAAVLARRHPPLAGLLVLALWMTVMVTWQWLAPMTPPLVGGPLALAVGAAALGARERWAPGGAPWLTVAAAGLLAAGLGLVTLQAVSSLWGAVGGLIAGGAGAFALARGRRWVPALGLAVGSLAALVMLMDQEAARTWPLAVVLAGGAALGVGVVGRRGPRWLAMGAAVLLLLALVFLLTVAWETGGRSFALGLAGGQMVLLVLVVIWQRGPAGDALALGLPVLAGLMILWAWGGWDPLGVADTPASALTPLQRALGDGQPMALLGTVLAALLVTWWGRGPLPMSLATVAGGLLVLSLLPVWPGPDWLAGTVLALTGLGLTRTLPGDGWARGGASAVMVLGAALVSLEAPLVGAVVVLGVSLILGLWALRRTDVPLTVGLGLCALGAYGTFQAWLLEVSLAAGAAGVAGAGILVGVMAWQGGRLARVPALDRS